MNSMPTGKTATYVPCPQCGRVAPSDVMFCPYCGYNHKTKNALGSAPQALPPNALPLHQTQPMPTPFQPHPLPPGVSVNIVCPVCANDRVQKVSGVVQHGSWSSQSSGVSLSETFVGNSMIPTVGVNNSSSAGASQLAKLLAPPLRPVMPSTFAWILMTVFFGFWSLVSLSNSSSEGVIVFGLLTAVGGYEWRHVWLRQRYDYPKQLQYWHYQTQLWSQLFYCSRCDHTYHPATRKAVPSAQTYQLLQ